MIGLASSVAFQFFPAADRQAELEIYRYLGNEIRMVFFYKNWRLRRSVLFLPASNRRAIEKVASLPCDSVIFDLEDSVAEEARETAHANLLEMVAGQDFGSREVVVRVTHPSAASFGADLNCALACGPDGILLPKVETEEEILGPAEAIAKRAQIWAMIETPKGLANLREICATSETVDLTCLVVGPNDLAKTTGARMEPGRAVMLPWLMQILATARCHDLCVLDGVYNNFKDLEGLEAECRQGASMGYDGKTLIHPAQIEIANRQFGISPQDYQRAVAIQAAFEQPENRSKAAIQMDGEMVERLHLETALELIRAYQGGQS